jgi:hypothetical protein
MSLRRSLNLMCATLALLGFSCGVGADDAMTDGPAVGAQGAGLMAVPESPSDDLEGASCKKGKTTYADGHGYATPSGPDNNWVINCCRDGKWTAETLKDKCDLN